MISHKLTFLYKTQKQSKQVKYTVITFTMSQFINNNS